MIFWAITIGMLAGAMLFVSGGRVLRLFAYHAGHGYGLGAVNAPRIFRYVPWPLLWVAGMLVTVAGLLLTVLAIGIARWIVLLVVAVLIYGIGKIVGSTIFYLLFKEDMKTAYNHLDRIQDRMARGEDQ